MHGDYSMGFQQVKLNQNEAKAPATPTTAVTPAKAKKKSWWSKKFARFEKNVVNPFRKNAFKKKKKKKTQKGTATKAAPTKLAAVEAPSKAASKKGFWNWLIGGKKKASVDNSSSTDAKELVAIHTGKRHKRTEVIEGDLYEDVELQDEPTVSEKKTSLSQEESGNIFEKLVWPFDGKKMEDKVVADEKAHKKKSILKKIDATVFAGDINERKKALAGGATGGGKKAATPVKTKLLAQQSDSRTTGAAAIKLQSKKLDFGWPAWAQLTNWTTPKAPKFPKFPWWGRRRRTQSQDAKKGKETGSTTKKRKTAAKVGPKRKFKPFKRSWAGRVLVQEGEGSESKAKVWPLTGTLFTRRRRQTTQERMEMTDSHWNHLRKHKARGIVSRIFGRRRSPAERKERGAQRQLRHAQNNVIRDERELQEAKTDAAQSRANVWEAFKRAKDAKRYKLSSEEEAGW